MKHLRQEQIDPLFAAASCDLHRLLFRLCYEHGFRISECLALTKAHVQRGFLIVKAAKRGKKRSEERVAPETLALWAKATATILPNTRVFPFTRQWASVLFHRACEKAHIELLPRQGIHSLRHSIAHHLLDAGAPLPVVQKQLRHKSIGSTGVYLEADARDVDRWRAKAVAGQVSQPAAPASLAEIQAEIKRLAALAASMQGAQGDAADSEDKAAWKVGVKFTQRGRIGMQISSS